MAQDVEEENYPARRILDEDRKKKRYKVDWEGINPQTRRAWSPTWEPYEYVSEVLVKEWKSKQRRRSESGMQKASRAALRDFDIKRNKSQTPSDEEYVSPPEEETGAWTSHRASTSDLRQPERPKPKTKRKSTTGDQPSSGSSKATGASNGLSTVISAGSLKALQSQKAKNRRHSEPSTSQTRLSEKAKGKRRRQDDPVASPERSRPAPKKSRNQKEAAEAMDYTTEEEEEDDDVPVVASRRRPSAGNNTSTTANRSDSPQRPLGRLSAIPDSLRMRTATTSVSTITHSISGSAAEGIFSEVSMLKQREKLPPSARKTNGSDDDEYGEQGITNATRRAQAARAGKVKKTSQPLSRHRSDDGASRSLAEASLPSFKKASNGSTLRDEDVQFNEHRRKVSSSVDVTETDWALLDAARKDVPEDVQESESLSMIPDSASPLTGDSLLSSTSPRQNGAGTVVEGPSIREPFRKSHSGGSRLAYANIEKPRMPVRVPEPEVFKSFLDSTQMTEDIQQFSSQASPPEGSSSEEIQRQLTTSSNAVVETAFPSTVGEPGIQAVDDTVPLDPETFVTAPQNIDVDMSEPVQHTTNARPDGSISIFDTPATAAELTLKKHSAQETTVAITTISNGEIADLPAAKPVITPAATVTQARILGPVEVVETSEKEREARSAVSKSTLIPSESIRQEILIFIDSPGYYIALQRQLTKQPAWDFELIVESNDNEQTAWHLLLDMSEGTFKLEKQVRRFVAVESSSGDDQVMALYNELLTAHAALKLSNDAATLRVGELESDIKFMREQDRLKAKQIGELELDKQRLENDVQILQQQVLLGVKQVELIWRAKEQRMREDLDMTKKQLALTQQLIVTSDIERLKGQAAQVEELEARERRRIEAAHLERRRQTMMQSIQSNVYTDFLASTFSQAGNGEQGEAAGSSQVQAALGSGGDSEDDEDFIGGSSDDSGSRSSDSYDSSDDAPAIQAPVPVHVPIPTDFSGVQYPDLAASDLINAALGSSEGILPGGLASISPAPLLDYVHIAQTAHAEDTSGETTEVTTSTSIPVHLSQSKDDKVESHPSVSSGVPFPDSEEILELDSGILESQLAYACSWRSEAGKECRALFSSQKELYDHVVDEHATP